ncbi:MarR family winged helix-turn-helix transcriptional regulator [Streptomyces gilvus]|uniref:MarR family winged helix-turn-helix transcriptional regulator n=1 Tax=Streptomyces gilvus TaxID=2920937 RepID=UPI001F0CE74C|nr:MarR family winged helix-turn-helix transcriptional regulator [Streptomyces sp. CME 23]MCH5677653.1 MarR family winged helix-turn-helix transcriptional regulator [Streptomyces sp. CME 23]
MVEPDALKPEEWDLWDRWMHAQRLLLQEIDRRLQAEFGISKAEFSVLVTLLRAPGREVRVVDMADSLGWEKSRVSHQLTRMERRGFVVRTESGASGRRTGIGLTPDGRRLAERAVVAHAGNVRRYFIDQLAPEQAAAVSAWSDHMIERLEQQGERGSVGATGGSASRT